MAVQAIGNDRRQETRDSDESERFRYLPCLDGLRAISILGVLGFHGMGAISSRISAVLNGSLGVDVFFVISGYLITSLLVQEEKDFGSFSLKRFYIRRSLRIWPAYYVFLMVGLAIGFASLSQVGISAVYLTNYDLTMGIGYAKPSGWEYRDAVDHLWSLAVEEQFYLFWPLLLWFVGSQALRVALGIIGVVYAGRLGLLLCGIPSLGVTAAFFIHLDKLMIGCVAALLWSKARYRPTIRRGLSGTWTPWLILAGLFFAVQTMPYPADPSTATRFLVWAFRLPLFLLLVTLLIGSLVVQPRSLLTTILEQRPMVWIGRLSYSLYLWHPLVFYKLWPDLLAKLPERIAGSRWLHAGVRESVCFAGTVLLAAASYYCIERPFLRLKERWEPKRRKR